MLTSPSMRPSPVVAQLGCTNQVRPVSLLSWSLLVTSCGLRATSRNRSAGALIEQWGYRLVGRRQYLSPSPLL